MFAKGFICNRILLILIVTIKSFLEQFGTSLYSFPAFCNSALCLYMHTISFYLNDINMVLFDGKVYSRSAEISVFLMAIHFTYFLN